MRGGDLIREVFGSESDSDDADELNRPGPSPPSPLMRPGCVVETPPARTRASGCSSRGRRWVKTRGGGSWTAYAPTTSWISQTMNHRRRRPIGAHPPAARATRRCGSAGITFRDGRSRSPTPSPSSRREDPATPTAKTTSRRRTATTTDDDDAVFPREVLARARTASGVFNQMIVNQYAPGEGLTPHVDLDAFADGVAVVSLRSTVVMDMYPPGFEPGTSHVPSNSTTVPVWLRPGDVLFLSRAARWEWAHGIAARDADPAEGETGSEGALVVRRGCRTSVTLRAMREDGHELRVPA